MKTFPTNFTIEKNKKTGSSPVWILKCPFATGTIYLSDRNFSVASWQGGVTTKSWINSWGAIDENIVSQISMSHVADFTITVIIDPNDSNNIGSLLWNISNKPETTDCELYLWFLDLNPATDPPQKIFVGNIVDFEQVDELIYRVCMVDQSVRYDKYVGTVIDTTTYPNADPDDVGKIGNIGYGILKQVPARAVVAGALDYLDAAMSAAQTTLNLIDASRFPASGSIGIDEEDITYTGKSGNQLTGLTRGVNGTGAVAHNRGIPVWEERSDFTYEAFSHPIKQFDNVYAVGNNAKAKITSICSALYTGNTGSQHPQWPWKAIVVVPAKITKTQAVQLLVNDGINVNDAINVVDGISVNDQIFVKDLLTVSDNISVDQGNHTHAAASQILSARVEDWQNLSGGWMYESTGSYRFDGDFTTCDHVISDNTTTRFFRRTSVGQAATPISFRQCVTSGAPNFSGTGTAYLYKNGGYTGSQIGIGGNSKTTVKGDWISATDWNDFINPGTYIQISGNSNLNVYEIWYEISYDPSPVYSGATGVVKTNGTGAYRTGDVTKSGSATKTGSATRSGSVTKSGTVSMSGNSVADTVIASQLVVDAQGYTDDASGTITGTPNALLEFPDHVIKHLLVTYGGWLAANWYTNANANFISKNYKFDGVITEKKKLKEWLTTLAFQCRCYFRIANGTAQLLWRPDALSSQKTITSNMIRMQQHYKTTVKVSRSLLDEVINKIEIHYNRNWMQSGKDAYQSVSKYSDSTSITAYGEKEKPDLFYFDFVNSQAMADDIRDFYLARYKNRKKLITMEVFLDNCELEFADNITIAPQSNLLCEIQKVNAYPGSGKEKRNDKITIIVKEY